MVALDIKPPSGLCTHERMTAYIASKGVTELYADNLEGLLKEKKDSLSDQKDYYQDRIDSIELRLESIEARLTRKFSDMEVAISMLQAQGQSLSGLGG